MDTETDSKVSLKPERNPSGRLEYDNTRSSGVSRRQMNLFLLLLFINTVLFAAFICLPSASPILKEMWANWQAERAQAREKQKLRDTVAACMTYTLPADQVVYAEPPADSAKLLASAGHARVVSDRPRRDGLFAQPFGNRQHSKEEELLLDCGWREAAVFAGVEPLNRLLNRSNSGSGLQSQIDETSVVFLHSVSTRAGTPRLVWIAMEANQSLDKRNETVSDGRTDTIYEVDTTRRVHAQVIDPENLDSMTLTSVEFIESPAARSRITIETPGDGTIGVKRWEPRGLWRIRAGQVDPADASHVTISYDIDGKPGVIDGRLNDGNRLVLTPRVGHLVQWTNSNSYTWDLSAPSTTQPTR